MGEAKNGPFRVGFDQKLKREFHGAKITSDAGWLLYRELDDAPGLASIARETLDDPRMGANALHSMTALLPPSVFNRLTEDTRRQRRGPRALAGRLHGKRFIESFTPWMENGSKWRGRR